MAKFSKMLVGPALAAGFIAFGYVATRAAEAPRTTEMVPVKGISFDIGSKRAVTYFKPTAGICNLTVMLADRSADEAAVQGAGSRVQMQVLPGKAARVDTADGKALEFGCKLGATAMTVKALEQVAWSRARS